MKRLLNVRWLALILTLMMVAVACSTEDPDATETTAAPDTTTTTAAGTATTAPAEEEPAEGRTILEVPYFCDVAGFNPFPETACRGGEALLAMFIPLIEVDENQQIFSNVLESWESSPDATEITLKVNPGLEWSDGTPITSADVAMSLHLHLNPNTSTRAGRLGGVVGVAEYADGTADSISGITTPDESTVVLELANPDAAWVANWASLVRLNTMFPAHILGDATPEEILTHPYFENFPVVSGAYKFVQFVPGQYIELERNENWSLGEAYFERVFYKIITDAEARLAQFQTGEIQFVDGVSATDVARLEATEGVTVASATGLNPNVIGMNYDHPLLQDPRVRQALIFAVDREGICQQVLLGYCSVSPTNQRLVGLEWALPTVDEGAIEYNYDPERAMELLAEAGWDSSNTLNLLARPDGAGTAVSAAIEIMQAQWAAVGVNVELVNVDVPTLLDNLGRAGRDPDSHMFWNAGAVFTLDPSSVQPYALCSTHYPAGPNLTYYCNEAVDGLWAEARAVADQDERAEIYKEIYLALNQDPDYVYFAVLDNNVAFDSRLKGIKPQGDIWQTFWNIGEWYWEE
ncbi:MAG TPA: ABC transporter substrate-binding protein [Acidimicrobiia bacterium]|nr:ABC transporter substrate-binding protein [Acidimicrobiia bacterium]